MMSKEEVIQKIVEEKGIEAIPNLISLLKDEDSETRELARDVLSVMGNEANDYILNEFKVRFEKNKEDDIVLLYLAEILTENNNKEIVPYLERMMNNYSDERAFPIIIEHLWKLTEEERYLDILETFLDDEEGLEELAIIAISHKPKKRVIDLLVKKYRTTENKSIQVFVLDSILKVLLADLSLAEYLKTKDDEISQKLQWHLEVEK